MKGNGDDREGMELLAGLPREMPPRRDPWPEIAARISATAPHRPLAPWVFAWWPQAAAALLVVVVGIIALRQVGHNPADPSAEPGGATMRMPAYADTLQMTEREYRAAFQEFRMLARGPANPHAPIEEYIDQGWAVMQQAEKELTAALRADPGDPYINERLVQLRARQVELLRQIAMAGMAWRHTI